MATITLGSVSTTFPNLSPVIRSVPFEHGDKLEKCDKNDEYRAKGCSNLLLTDAQVSFNRYHKQSYSDLADEAARLMSVHDYSSIVSGMSSYLGVLTELKEAINYHLTYLKTFEMGVNMSNKKRCCQKKDSVRGYKTIDKSFLAEVEVLIADTQGVIKSVGEAEAVYDDLESSDRERDEADARANSTIALSNSRIANASLTVEEMKKEELLRKIFTGILVGGIVFAAYKIFKSFKK